MVRLTGLVAAVSAWVLALATSQLRNATVSDLIIGLAVAAVGLLAITGLRGLTGLQAASLLADSGGSSGRSSGREGLHHRVDVLEQHMGRSGRDRSQPRRARRKQGACGRLGSPGRRLVLRRPGPARPSQQASRPPCLAGLC